MAAHGGKHPDRQIREFGAGARWRPAGCALEHAAVRLDDAEYPARMARLRCELEIVGSQPIRDLPARRATGWHGGLMAQGD
jgi:hypothetical protein